MLNNIFTKVTSLQFFQLLKYSTLVLISILFAKSSFSQNQIGEYETLIFIASGISFFWLNSIIKAFLANYKQQKEKTSEIFNFYLLILFFGVLIFAILQFLLISKITNLYTVKYFNLFIYYVLLLGTSSISEYLLLVNDKIKTIYIYGIISYLIQLIIVGVSIFVYKSLEYVLYSLIGISILRNIYSFFLVSKFSLFIFSWDYIKSNIRLSYPLMFSFLLSGSAQYIDGFIVKYKFDESTFAIFRYGTKEFPLIVILSDALSNAMLGDFNNNIKDALKTLKEKSEKLINFLFPISIILLIFSNYLFEYVFNKQFSESAGVFDIYLLLVIIRLVFPQTVMLGLKNTKTIFTASVIEFIINVSLSLIFVQYFGILGVAFATVIAFLSEKLFLIIRTKSLYKISPKSYISVNRLLIFAVVLIIIFIAKSFYTF